MTFSELIREARSAKEWIVQLRRTIHKHPELMYEEFETSKLVQSTLDSLGVEYQAGVAETGVVATLGRRDGPCVALRADMDALPIEEEADVDFRSEIPGKMHACGHDCHTAMLLGAAKILKTRESTINGTVKLFFQPAEEGGAGAKRMMDQGALRDPDVQRIFGLHVWHLAESGTIASRAGTFLAATNCFDIVVSGKGGHAALPHMTIDPVVTAAKTVTELQTIASRETDPLSSLVVSITAINGGAAFNVIPPEVKLRGTIRALTTAELSLAKTRVSEITEAIAKANLCQANVRFPEIDYSSTVNDAHCWELAGAIWQDEFGPGTVIESSPLMGGEDFSFYTEEVPGCFVGLGIRSEQVGSVYSVHHPKFKVDEDALPLGSALHAAYALRSLAELAS